MFYHYKDTKLSTNKQIIHTKNKVYLRVSIVRPLPPQESNIKISKNGKFHFFFTLLKKFSTFLNVYSRVSTVLPPCTCLFYSIYSWVARRLGGVRCETL